MLFPAIPPLPGQSVLILMLQLAGLIIAARLGAELARRVGLPDVVGELSAGLVLGPSVFGHFFPQVFAALFPPVALQFHLLELITWLGMLLLMLLTGIETDVRLLRNLGRPALVASISGMVLPFILGFILGLAMPESYLVRPESRMYFALFLATAMSISAMPVIAKILLDLGLTRRNIGLVILSAGVIDDTAGWIILSLLAGAVRGNASLTQLGISIGGLVVFLALAFFALLPAMSWLMRVTTQRFKSENSDMALIIAFTLLCAAATDSIGVHAVFGAFVAGCLLRQVPHLRRETLHKLESVVFTTFAPVFFASVGLKVDLWQLQGGTMLAIVLGVAIAGKLIGCTVGSLIGGLRFWEGFSIAVAMNARGAMGLVVAMIGLSLGLLNAQMYSTIVLVAIVTSFMAPILLRGTMRMVRITEDEQRRMAIEAARGVFDPQRLHSLVPTAGGRHALLAAKIALVVARSSAIPPTILYVDKAAGFFAKLKRRRRNSQFGNDVDEQLQEISRFAVEQNLPAPVMQKQSGRDVSAIVCSEAFKGYELLMLGATENKNRIGDTVEELVNTAPCHAVIVRSALDNKSELPKRLLVPIDGGLSSRVAVEFAVRYAEGLGTEAHLTLAYLREAESTAAESRESSFDLATDVMSALSSEGGLEKLSPVFKATAVRAVALAQDKDASGFSIVSEAQTGKYDAVVIGAENRAIHNRLFFGLENQKLLEQSPVTIILVVPKIAATSRGASR